jgi:predicted phosphoribosyltransferase
MKAKIHELHKFHEQLRVFQDRFEAGKVLGMMMQPDYTRINDGMILAVPAGGVPVGLVIKSLLELPFDLIIVRKLKIPGNPEAGFGAMALDGTVFLNQNLLAGLRLSDAQIEDEKRRVSLELEKRNAMFRQNLPFPDLSGNRVILVDDGLASGFTMLAAVDMVKKAGAKKIIVAVPTAPQNSIGLISKKVDEIYCANVRTTPFFAVAEAYRHWYDLDEEEIREFLEFSNNS